MSCVQHVSAQTFYAKNYRVESGLPSSQIHDIKQDHEGNLWIASDLGLTRYNGLNFKSYSQKEGLSDNSISKLFVDSKGQIWCLGANQSLSVFNDNQASKFQYSKELESAIGQNFIRTFQVDSNSTLYLGMAQPCTDKAFEITCSSNGIVEKTAKKSNFYIQPKFKNYFGGNACPGSQAELELGEANNQKITIEASYGTILSVANSRKALIAVTDQYVIDLNTKKNYRLSSTHSGASLLDSKGNLWVSTYSGLLFFKNGNLLQKPIELLNDISVTTVFEDKDGAIWVGTSSKGLFYYKNLYLTVVNELNGIYEPDVVSIVGHKSFLYFVDSRNQVYVLNSANNIQRVSELSSKVQGGINTPRGPLFIESQTRKSSKYSFPINGLSICKGNQNDWWVGKIYNFSNYKNGKEVFNSASIDFKRRVNAVKWNNKQLLVGSLKGLYTYNPINSSLNLIEKTKDLRIDDIEIKGDSILFISRGNGLGIFVDGKLKMITEKQGLVSNFTNDLHLFNNEIWCATNSGLACIKDGDIISIGTKDGLPSAEINSIWVGQKAIYYGSRKGLGILDRSFLKHKKRQLETKILSVNNNAGTVKIENNLIELPADHGSIKISLLATDFRINDPIEYKYKLDKDSAWTYTTQPVATFAALPSGNSTFMCSALNHQGVWGPTNSILKFKVNSPIYLQWWFVALALLLTAGLVWLVMQWRFKLAAKEEKNQNELNTLKIKALSSQMNPHFIFNSLNSIQNFLVENDLRMSNKYLSKFARLMRLILNSSNETFVPLKDVITTLELYMELEQLRFGNRFDFEINIDPKITVERTRIPSMLLQPFLENAILHGILPKTEKGLISLDLTLENNQNLHAVISDNGVGRDFHANKLGKKHKSHGLRITKERLKVFESYLGNKFNASIHDLKNSEGKPEGTRVELSLPYQNS